MDSSIYITDAILGWVYDVVNIYCLFSHDVTNIQTTKPLILPTYYLNDV